MSAFFIIFFALFSLINYYIFIRGWQSLSIVPAAKPFYIIAFLLASTSYILSKVIKKYIPVVLYEFMDFIGSFWFAFILYFVLILVIIDISRLLNYFFHFYPVSISQNYGMVKLYTFFTVVLLALAIVLYGFYNSRNFKVNTISISIPKQESKLDSLNIVHISDVHISSINNHKFLNKAIDKINALNPDIILIAGDFVDERADYLRANNLGEPLKKLKSKYGAYAASGNHEFINGGQSVIDYIAECGVTWVNDETITIDNAFHLAGRHDRAMKGFIGIARKELNKVLENRNGLPLILMDHTPLKLEEAMNNNVDLQISGHTHNGQMFPLNFITRKVYEVSWGYKKKNNTHYYISSGLGQWGPPVKIGNDAEIVNIKVKFE